MHFHISANLTKDGSADLRRFRINVTQRAGHDYDVFALLVDQTVERDQFSELAVTVDWTQPGLFSINLVLRNLTKFE